MAKMLGKVDLLGLNSMGQNPGLRLGWGALIGGGTAAASTLAMRISGNPTLAGNAELGGLGVGLAVSGAMYAMKSTRHAALGAALGSVIAAGIAYLQKTLMGGATAVAVVPGTAGMGVPSIRALNGLGIPQARALNGFGVPMVSPTPTPVGTIPGVAGNQLASPGLSSPPVSLLGPQSPQAAHLRGIGGPAVHGLSAAYGATLLGGGR